MKIRTAVIPAAGFGTRFLPITKTIQKEMLPILDRPVVDYLVDDLVKAGVEDIIFVITQQNKQVLHYYQENRRLEKYLQQTGRQQLYEKISNLHQKARFHFVKQPSDGLVGTAIPVSLCRSYLENEEAFFVFMGDNILYNADGSSEAARMIAYREKTGAAAIASFIPQAKEKLHLYGVASIKEERGVPYLTQLVEKPAPGTAPSNLMNISQYILTPAIFDIIEKQTPNPQSGELYLTDTITQLAQTEGVAIYQPQGQYLDCGHPAGWLQANLLMAKDTAELGQELRATLQEISLSD